MRYLLATAMFLFYFGAAQAQDGECASLKKAIYSKPNPENKLTRDIQELESLVKEDVKCAKNLLGRMYAEGLYFPVDKDRSYAIFYDLAQKNYPPAQYNLAHTLTTQSDAEPELVLTYLQGLIIAYPMNDDYRYLVPKAVDLGRAYLDTLSDRSYTGYAALRDRFELAVKTSAQGAATELIAATKASKDRADMVAGILALGMFAYAAAPALGNALTTSAPRMPVPSPKFYQVNTPRGNIYQFSAPPVGYGNYPVPGAVPIF